MTKKEINHAVMEFIQLDEAERNYRKGLDEAICNLKVKRSMSINKNIYQLVYKSWQGSKIAKEFSIRSLPTFIVSNSMEPSGELNRLTGSWPIEKIKETI